MTTINTDYNNTELLDQELSFDELQQINGEGDPNFYEQLGLPRNFGITGATHGPLATAGLAGGLLPLG